jgi:hypothetical protein
MQRIGGGVLIAFEKIRELEKLRSKELTNKNKITVGFIESLIKL